MTLVYNATAVGGWSGMRPSFCPNWKGGRRLHLEYRIPSRANIYDINGRALAYQGTAVTLGVIPGRIEDEPAC
jgi:hypothetical protein